MSRARMIIPAAGNPTRDVVQRVLRTGRRRGRGIDEYRHVGDSSVATVFLLARSAGRAA